MSKDSLTALSASRIKTLQTCSWIYWAKYKLKVPDKSNDGASRGTICHLIFELFGEKRHKHHYSAIVKAGTVKASAAVYRLILHHAKKLNVADDENLQLIDEMTVNGLNYDFFGKDKLGLKEAHSERSFEITKDEGDIKYKIRGFIDKLFLYKDNSAIIRDFKTSKQVFKGKDLTDNLQDLMYSLAISYLYPKYHNRISEFLFLKFELGTDLLGNTAKGVVRMDSIDNDELKGFEYQLTAIQNTIDNFDEDLGRSSLAAKKGYPKDGSFGGPLACGKKGFKKSRGEYLLDKFGEKIPAYICPFREARDYYVILDENGNKIKGGFTQEELEGELKKGQSILKQKYAGCPHWNNKEVLDDLMSGF
tara:strand:+ start:22336 stop:23424 length:1089 start_codon:yes stop_codon:yes gene_type:complete